MKKWITCPFKDCRTAFKKGKVPAGYTRTEKEAIKMMKEHVLECHSLRDIENMVERVITLHLEGIPEWLGDY